MTEQTGATEAQAATVTQPQAGSSQTAQAASESPAAGATQTAQAASAEPEAISLEEAGRLRRENRNLRDRAKEAEQQATEYQSQLASLDERDQTDAEKALKQARREGAEQLLGTVRVALAKTALKAAGITNERLLATMARDEAFQKVRITGEGEIVGLDEAVEEFRAAAEELMPKLTPRPGGAWDGSEGGGTRSDVAPGMDRLRAAYSAPDPRR